MGWNFFNYLLMRSIEMKSGEREKTIRMVLFSFSSPEVLEEYYGV